jgi:hypothetical protein
MAAVPPIQAEVPSIGEKGEGPFTSPEKRGANDTYESEPSLTDDGDFAGKNPFADPDVAAYWKGVYDEATYECRHVFDPNLTWSEEEEKRIIRKLDWRVCAWAVS